MFIVHIQYYNCTSILPFCHCHANINISMTPSLGLMSLLWGGFFSKKKKLTPSQANCFLLNCPKTSMFSGGNIISARDWIFIEQFLGRTRPTIAHYLDNLASLSCDFIQNCTIFFLNPLPLPNLFFNTRPSVMEVSP